MHCIETLKCCKLAASPTVSLTVSPTTSIPSALPSVSPTISLLTDVKKLSVICRTGRNKDNWRRAKQLVRNLEIPDRCDTKKFQNKHRRLLKILNGSKKQAWRRFCSVVRHIKIESKSGCAE